MIRRLAVVTCVSALCLVGAACAEEADAPPASSERADDAPLAPTDLGAGLVADLPEGTAVEPLAPTGEPGESAETAETADDGECRYLQGSVGEGDDRIELSLNATACGDGEPDSRIGNGSHGRYVTVDDVAEPGDLEAAAVPAGDLTTFTQPYYECTNECNDYEDNVGLLDLSSPPDAGYPVLQLLAAKGDAPMGAVVDLAAAVRPA